MFWFEGPLNSIAELCIRSFTRFPDVTVSVYTYERVPSANIRGCLWMDANEIIPYEIANPYARNFCSAAVADLFRYALLFKRGGWYFDTDCLLIRRLNPLFDQEYVFGLQEKKVVNNAVLKFPLNDPILNAMYQECIHFGTEKYRWGMIGRFGRPRRFFQRYHWGMFGPEMLTKHLEESGMIEKAVPPVFFYPIPWTHPEALRQPFILNERTFIVHLWNEQLRRNGWNVNDLNPSFLTLARGDGLV